MLVIRSLRGKDLLEIELVGVDSITDNSLNEAKNKLGTNPERSDGSVLTSDLSQEVSQGWEGQYSILMNAQSQKQLHLGTVYMLMGIALTALVPVLSLYKGCSRLG